MRHDAVISYAYESPGYRVIQGENAVDCVPAELAMLGAQRVLVVCSQSAVTSGLIRRVEAALGNHCIGAVTGVPHGIANAIVVPHAVRFNPRPITNPQEIESILEAVW